LPMTPERWEIIRSIFEAVRGLPPEEQRDELSRCCGQDPTLLAELESLIVHDAAAERESFLAAPTVTLPPPDSTRPLAPGSRVGPHEIREKLGEGGMGSVYLGARVEDYEQLVAVKFLRPGIGEAYLKRFQAERQLLAKLEHPHIVRLLDGGTAHDGSPYFVM